jgi:hypothetical protein
MVKAIIDINEKTNQILNIVKAKYNLNTKSEAIIKMAAEYEENVLESRLKPEYVEKIKGVMDEEPIRIPEGMSLLEYIESLSEVEDNECNV